MADTEIYVDGLATLQIKNMNDWLDAVRMQIMSGKNPNSKDLYLKVLESSHIQEEEYFFHTIHSDWDSIIRTIREVHQFAIESAPIERTTPTDKQFERMIQNLRFQSNPIESFWKVFCDSLQIDYDKLSDEQHSTMKQIFKESKLLKTFPNRKNKGKK